ncbi:MCE family protein [Gordonia jinhuaensis]|uniref:Hypothetical MCE-family protein n=1 Tax=Gordonia jinhuaensis TaxID=1517702 RepID=A0A916WZH3_9ACTN|nr:MlaD family protein [Gordonia jinhuaensis]GGB45430.1 hypothetical MCE-family protein [Gordonia jinhuaensis]
MRITRFVRIQLIIFAIVSVISLVVVGVFYVQIPTMLGFGRYTLTLQLPATGGLYANGNVSLRGVDVGRVRSVTLTPDGVRARLSIDSDTKIPRSSVASVRSMSAIGEQYVEFVPTDNGPSGNFPDGSVIRTDNIPTDVSTMLSAADELLGSIGSNDLRTVIDEAFTAFDGTAADLARLIDSMSLFVDAANKNAQPTIDLIEQARPLLDSQAVTTGEIRQWTANMVKVTDHLRADTPSITGILDKGPGAAGAAQELFASMNQTLPLLFSNLGTTARTLAVYLPNLRQILVMYPRLMAVLITAVNTEDNRKGANVDYSLAFQDPGTCTVGFLPFGDRRSSAVQTPRELPSGLLCRVPQDDQLAVRGTRNFPCVEFPGRRAPTPEECRTGYKPLGKNVPIIIGPGVGTTTQATPSSYRPGTAVYGGGYDPSSGTTIGPDGKTYALGLGDDTQGGDATWQTLIAGTVK